MFEEFDPVVQTVGLKPRLPQPPSDHVQTGNTPAVEGYSLSDLVDRYPARRSHTTTMLLVAALSLALPGLFYCMYHLPQNTPIHGIMKVCGVATCVTLLVWALSLLVTLAGLVKYASFDMGEGNL